MSDEAIGAPEPEPEPEPVSVHATAVLLGARALLIRGVAGSGKSLLAVRLLQESAFRRSPFARLVGDDRVLLRAAHGRLLVRPVPALAGLIEIRGLGIRRVPHEPQAIVGYVIDLAAPDATRLPDAAACDVEIERVTLPRMAVAACVDPLPLLLATLNCGPCATASRDAHVASHR